MVASRTAAKLIAARATAAPDDRLVTASALAALAILLLMLLAGTATAEDAAPKRQDRAGSAIAAAQNDDAVPHFPANTHYTTIKLTRAATARYPRAGATLTYGNHSFCCILCCSKSAA
jgi:hypothetical protein